MERVTREERLGVPTFVQLRSLAKSTGFSHSGNDTPESAARAEFKQLAGLYGLTDGEIDTAPLHHVQVLQGGGSLVQLTNQRDGVEVFRERATVLLDAQLKATAIGGYLGSTHRTQVATKSGTTHRLDAAGAVARALEDFGFPVSMGQWLQPVEHHPDKKTGAYVQFALPAGVTGDKGATLSMPARAKPVWFRLPDGLVSAFYVEVQGKDEDEDFAYAYVIAADGARLLLRHSLTSHAADFSYRVWADSATGVPLPGPQGRNAMPHPTGVPDGYAASFVQAPLVTVSGALARTNAPWLAESATTTSGNNVQAFANLVSPDGLAPSDVNRCDALHGHDLIACSTAPFTFDYRYDHGRLPLADRSQMAASVVNLFYTTNWLHDWFYDAGFDEAAGNAQKVNDGAVGLDEDAMRAQALDVRGTNNANMTTPADGSPPTMRMYRFINSTLPQARVVSPTSVGISGAAAGATFGALSFDLLGELSTTASDRNEACSALPPGSLVGKIALVNRGVCGFALKTLNVQNAGAIGIVVANNVTGAASSMGGNGVDFPTIAAIHISHADGAKLQTAMSAGTVTLQMQKKPPEERSSAMDNGIIAHEWGHYISQRLIGDGSGLQTNHSAGLGEGWGDFHAMLLLVGDNDRHQPGNTRFEGAYSTSGYATAAVEGPAYDSANTALFGLRRYPYSTDLGKNPLSLRHIVHGAALPGGVPINPNAGGNSEVHNAGEVWTSMLWECYASLLNAHPFEEAQRRMKHYLVAGYKLTPVNPTLTEARDALLAPMAMADSSDYMRCSVGFVKRGAGALAVVPDRYSATNAGVVESRSDSGLLAIDRLQWSMHAANAQRCDADDVLDNGETGVLSMSVRNNGFTSVNGAQWVVSADSSLLSFPDGNTLTVPDVSPGDTVVVHARVRLNGLGAPGSTFIKAQLIQSGQPSPSESILYVPLHQDWVPNSLASDDAQALPSVMEFGSNTPTTAGAWNARLVGGTAQPLSWRYTAAAPNHWGSHWMRTPPLHVADAGDFTVSFKHRHQFEFDGQAKYDGGQLMISTDDGATWARVGDSVYNGTLFAGQDGRNPAQGQPAFVATNSDWPRMQTVTVHLGSDYAGKRVRLAWVIQTDTFQGSEGWEVDDIVFTGLTNTPFPRVISDAQVCSGPSTLSVSGGNAQAAQVLTAFDKPLRVRLLSARELPVANSVVTFTAPASGASAVLSVSSAVTDSEGYAQVTATANGVLGSYTVTAMAGGISVPFALTNTVVPVDPGATPLSISGPSPNGQGVVTITVVGAVSALPASARFSNDVFADAAGVGAPALAGHQFPFGLAKFKLEGVGQRNTVTLRVRYPAAIPAGAAYWKYGKISPDESPVWHEIPMTVISSDTVEITLADGMLGDADATPDGTITDPGGLAVRAAVAPGAGAVAPTPVPSLSVWAWMMLSMVLAGTAITARVGNRKRLVCEA